MDAVSTWKQVLAASVWAGPLTQLPAQWNFMFSLSYQGFTSGFKVQIQTLSQQGLTGATSADTLAAVHSARILCLLFSPELFILSICVTLSLCNVTTEVGEGMLPSHLPTDSECACSFQVFFLPFFTHFSSHLPVKWGTCFLLGAERSQPPASSGMTDGPSST